MKLKEIRKKKNLTQKDVSESLGIPINTYTQYELEYREAPIDFYIKLANFYGVTLDYLLDNPNPANEKKIRVFSARRRINRHLQRTLRF